MSRKCEGTQRRWGGSGRRCQCSSEQRTGRVGRGGAGLRPLVPRPRPRPGATGGAGRPGPAPASAAASARGAWGRLRGHGGSRSRSAAGARLCRGLAGPAPGRGPPQKPGPASAGPCAAVGPRVPGSPRPGRARPSGPARSRVLPLPLPPRRQRRPRAGLAAACARAEPEETGWARRPLSSLPPSLAGCLAGWQTRAGSGGPGGGAASARCKEPGRKALEAAGSLRHNRVTDAHDAGAGACLLPLPGARLAGAPGPTSKTAGPGCLCRPSVRPWAPGGCPGAPTPSLPVPPGLGLEQSPGAVSRAGVGWDARILPFVPVAGRWARCRSWPAARLAGLARPRAGPRTAWPFSKVSWGWLESSVPERLAGGASASHLPAESTRAPAAVPRGCLPGAWGSRLQGARAWVGTETPGESDGTAAAVSSCS